MELIKCFKSIKEHAFVASEYPVVITLEDHLTPDLQAKVAEVSIYTFFLKGIIGFQPFMFLLHIILSPISRWSLKLLETYCFLLAQNA